MTDIDDTPTSRPGSQSAGAPGADLPLDAVVLAAGEGSRMRSARPKPIHRLCGRPMLQYVVDSLSGAHVGRVVIVIGHRGDWVAKTMREWVDGVDLAFVEQAQQRGTGDAASVGLVGLSDETDDGDVIVLPGDTPLLRPETISALVAHHRATGAAATLLSARMADPTGYGRVVRGPDGRVLRIVEHRDATPDEHLIDEVNTSIYCFRRSLLAPALRRIGPDNAQGEYYLTDVVEVFNSTGHRVEAVVADDADETLGVNDRLQLAAAEAVLRRRTNEQLQRNGVTMVDPDAVYVDTTVTVGRDVTLFPGTILQGATVVGDDSEIGPDTRLVDCTVGAETRIERATGRNAVVGDRSTVGPYAVLEPGAEVPSDTSTGAFYTARPEL